jgi:hypothetical protein
LGKTLFVRIIPERKRFFVPAAVFFVPSQKIHERAMAHGRDRGLGAPGRRVGGESRAAPPPIQ